MWWKDALIYQIYPRSFQDSGDDGVGDLRGILRRLDYLESLNVDAIWISPFFKSPMKDFGYDVSDYCAVDPLFGSNEDFEELVKQCHRREIKVIIDLVLSHTSDQHPWFKESGDPDSGKADWYVWADGDPSTPPNNWLAVFGGSAWTWHPGRRQYYLHNFLVEQPDLNFHNPQVQDALLDVCRFWFDRGVDGFRLDVCNYYFHDQGLRSNPVVEREHFNPYEKQRHLYNRSRPETVGFLQRMRDLADSYQDRFLMGEIFTHQPVLRMREYTGGPGPLHSAYSFAFFQPRMTRGLFKTTVEDFFTPSEKSWPSWSLSNHDVMRVNSRWGWQTPQTAKALLVLLMLLRGTRIVYQGEELGLSESDVPFERLQDPYGKQFYPEFKGRDGCRTPLLWDSTKNAGFSSHEPWLPLDKTQLDLMVAVQDQKDDSTLNFFRELARWSGKNLKASQSIEFLIDEPGWVVYNRDRTVFTGVNLTRETRKVALGQELRLLQGLSADAEIRGSEGIINPGGYFVAM